jgi:hypothetical protein
VTVRALVPFAALLAVAAACRSLAPVALSVEIPGVSRLAPGSFDEIIVAKFLDEAPSPDIEAGREFQAFLVDGLARAFRGPVTAAAGPPNTAAAGHERAILLTGSVRLAGEVRKALQVKNVPFDSPFKTAHRGLLEHRHWYFRVDLTVVSVPTGATLHRQTFQEERDYIELDKPADFALAELSDRVGAKLFPILLGKPTFEPRTLLKR